MVTVRLNFQSHLGFHKDQSWARYFSCFIINDLPDNIQSNVRLFADDTAVYLTVQGQEDVDILQADLNVLQEWEKAWDMEFNPSKCQVLHISRSRRPIKHPYTMHGQVPDSIDHARYLIYILYL